jgi:hypothetical protein
MITADPDAAAATAMRRIAPGWATARPGQTVVSSASSAPLRKKPPATSDMVRGVATTGRNLSHRGSDVVIRRPFAPAPFRIDSTHEET